MVRVHMEGEQGSIEGIFTGIWADHYVIRNAEFVEAPGSQHPLLGQDVRIPRDRVLFLQTLR